MSLRPTRCFLLLSLLVLTGLAHGEDPKPMATINVSLVVNSIGYEVWSQIGMDKEALETIKLLKAQRAELRKRVVEAKDEIELQHVNKDIQFNLSKTQQLQSLSSNSGSSNRSRQDSSAVVKDFLTTTYKGRYSLIVDTSNQNSGSSSSPIVLNELKVVDITGEVIAAIKAANE